MNKQKGFVWIVVALVVILVIIFFWNKKAVAPTGGEPATSTPAIIDTSSEATAPATTATKPASPAPKPKAPVITTPKMTSTGAYIISYTSTGFSPAALSIPAGKSVHIVNNSNNAMRISPVDTKNEPYASFNGSKSVGKGGYFDYTFVARGVYGYKNLNVLYHTGTITVY